MQILRTDAVALAILDLLLCTLKQCLHLPMWRPGVKLFQPSTAIAAVFLVTVTYLLVLDMWRGRAGQQVCLWVSVSQHKDGDVLLSVQ